MKRTSLFLALALLLGACASADDEPLAEGGESPAVETGGAAAPATAVAVTCAPQTERMALAGRASAYDSTVVSVGGAQAKVCYGRPAARGRTIFGELIPFGELWRTGANEPTTIHTPVAARIAGIAVEPGSYSLYTVPGEREWTIIVNRSTSQWGIEGQYTPAIEAQEVGRATLPVERTDAPVETFTITSAPEALLLEWENTRVRVPVAAG